MSETIPPNTTLAHYTIVAKIGAGGMGEVYRARDEKLNREVAIKVLPTDIARDEERLMRFKREAQILASLNHPNIAAIYGFEDSNHTVALVMELVEGPTLEDRLASGPIPQAETLAIARQIAEAFEVAHERGIIHRDLKPANVKVTSDDKVKVLDFGLAKVVSSDTELSDLSNSPTMIKGTAAGVILGTAAYMSPEQARGRPVDKRTDLWAFGVVLFEMLTGKRLFKGDTASDVIAAVLTQEVDWTALPDVTPPPIRRLLRRCLEKDPRKRLSDASTARLEIDEAISGGDDNRTIEGKASPERLRRGSFLFAALSAALLIAIVVGILIWTTKQTGPTSASQFTLTIVPPAGIQLRPVGTMGSVPQISPDGSAVIFEGENPRGMYVRHLDSLELLKVAGSEAVTNEAFWHGSTAISVPTSAQQLAEIQLPDGAPENVIPLNGFTRGGSWSNQGTLLISRMSHLVTRKPDGTPLSISIPDKRPGALLYPEFLTGSEDFLVFFKPDVGEGEVWLATLDQGVVTKTTVLLKNDTAARYTAWDGGRILFVKNDNLYSQRLNRGSRAVEGQPELVVKGVSSQPGLMRADFSVSENGTVAWRPGHAALAQVTVFDRKGAVIDTAGQPGAIDSVYVSPSDDSRLLVLGASDGLVEVGQSGLFALPHDAVWFNWLADGKRVLGLQGENRLVARSADNIGSSEEIGQLPTGSFSLKLLSPDGQFVLARIPPSGGGGWARLSDTSKNAWTPLVGTDELHADFGFSPDGHFIIYDAFAPSTGIYVQPFPGPGRRQLIDQSGIDPAWRGDGKEIVFVRDNAVWSVAVNMSSETPTFASPVKLFEGIRRAPGAVAQSQGLAISRDGSRIFIVQGVEQPETNVVNIMTSFTTRSR